MSSPKEKFDELGREKVRCKVCRRWYHRLDVHLKKHGLTVQGYKDTYGADTPTISEAASEKARAAARATVAIRTGKDAGLSTASSAEPFKIGAARLFQRVDLEDGEDQFVPEHDEKWIPGKRQMEEWEQLAIGIQNVMPVYMHGPTGCGKSTGAMELAAALNQPAIRVQMSQQFKESTMIGKTDLVVDKDTGFQVTRQSEGLLPMCMRRGWWLIVDEFTAAPPGIMFAMQAALEGQPLLLPNGDVVKPHKYFRFIATDNTTGRGDETGLYAGTHVMNESTMDRFGVVIACDYPNSDDEAKIVMSKGGVDLKTALSMISVAKKVREGLANETCYCTLSTRSLIAWAMLTQELGDVRKASRPAVINKLSKDDAKFVNGLIQRHFGGDV